jgi:hypothetical protein
MLLTVGIALTVNSTARGAEIAGGKYALFAAGGSQEETADDNDTSTVTVETEVYKVAEDGEEAGDADYQPYTVVMTSDGLVDSQALEELRNMVDELVKAGELSETGADQLRQALDKVLAPVTVYTTGDKAVAKTYRSIVVEQGKEAQAEAAAKAYSLALSGDGENGVWSITVDEGDGGAPVDLTIDHDGTVHSLQIETGEDGKVTVTGEGFSDEELAKIRQALEAADAHDAAIELKDGKIIMLPHSEGGADTEALILESLPELKELGRLEELFEEGMISEGELESEAQLLFLKEMPELKELERLDELHDQGIISEAELEHEAQLLFLKEMPELKELERLEDLFQEGMINEAELENEAQLLFLKEMPELKELELSKLDKLDALDSLAELKELQPLREADVDQLLKLGDQDLALGLLKQPASEDSTLEAEIAAVLEQIEQLLRAFAAKHADN